MMTNAARSKLTALTCALSLALASSTQAEVIFQDNFSDGNRDGWYSTSPGRVIDVDNGRLVLPSATSGSGNFLTYFTTTNLAVGDSINLSFNFKVNGTFPGEAFRFGLLNSGGVKISGDLPVANPPGTFNGYIGYAGFQSMGSDYQVIRYRTETGAADSLWTTGTGGFSSTLGSRNVSLELTGDGTTIYDATIYIERTGASSLAISTTVNGFVTNAVHDSATNFTFDTIAIHQGSSAVSMSFDDFSVSVIPEPAHWAALLGLGVLGVLVVRRRK